MQTRALELYDDIQHSAWSRPPAFPHGGAGLVSSIDDYHAFAQMLLLQGKVGDTRILSRLSVQTMITDHLTPAQKAVSGLVPGQFDHRGWGFGVCVVTARDDLSAVPGRYGWDGGYGTSWWSDPDEDLIGILMTQRAGFPQFSSVYLDFWTSVYPGHRRLGRFLSCNERAWSGSNSMGIARPLLEIGQQPGEQSHQRQVGTDLVDIFDTGPVGEHAEQGRTETADTERKSEEHAGDHAHLPGYQLLPVNHDGRKGRGRDQSCDHRHGSGPEQTPCGNKVVAMAPGIENQITNLRPKRSPNGPPASVPTAMDARNTNNRNWPSCTDKGRNDGSGRKCNNW